MLGRLLIALFATWLAIAPALASSCAAGCDSVGTPTLHTRLAHVDSVKQQLDCHGAGEQPGDPVDSEMPSMAIACFAAGVASIPTFHPQLVHAEPVSEQHLPVLLPRTSFKTAPLTKPPQV